MTAPASYHLFDGRCLDNSSILSFVAAGHYPLSFFVPSSTQWIVLSDRFFAYHNSSDDFLQLNYQVRLLSDSSVVSNYFQAVSLLDCSSPTSGLIPNPWNDVTNARLFLVSLLIPVVVVLALGFLFGQSTKFRS